LVFHLYAHGDFLFNYHLSRFLLGQYTGADTASSAEVCFFRDSIDNKTLHIGPEVSNFTSAN
ncbi:hypothetical protein, partial [Castellaniella denitrificans]